MIVHPLFCPHITRMREFELTAAILSELDIRSESPLGLPLVFADEEVLALAYQIACANEIYADPIGRSGARFRALVTAAEAAWLVAHQLYGRIRILLRERKRRLNNEPYWAQAQGCPDSSCTRDAIGAVT